MSYLSSVLTDALKAANLTQTAVAASAGITHAQVNRACRGTVEVKGDTIHAIVRVLPEEHRGPVTVAWLKDQLEPDLLHYVMIATADPRLRESESQGLPETLTPERRDLVMWVATEIERHGAVFDMLRGLREIAKPRNS